ncbi:hypothetical protein L1987_87382 [Smallanthus sonchifolius]|nr:hypothetical protein L1987_87382 [Smallanthus sonchifolius]
MMRVLFVCSDVQLFLNSSFSKRTCGIYLFFWFCVFIFCGIILSYKRGSLGTCDARSDIHCLLSFEHAVSPRNVREMSYLLPHLHSGWAVDQAILAEEERLVVIRFGHDWDETCMQMDEVLASVAETLKNFAVIYLVDITEVPDFNTMYELYDPSTIMFFFRNKHIMIDLGTGNNNKINWAMKDKQEFIDIVETVYRGARKGRGLVIAPKDYSTKYRY